MTYGALDVRDAVDTVSLLLSIYYPKVLVQNSLFVWYFIRGLNAQGFLAGAHDSNVRVGQIASQLLSEHIFEVGGLYFFSVVEVKTHFASCALQILKQFFLAALVIPFAQGAIQF